VNLPPCVLAEMEKSELEVLGDHAPRIATTTIVWVGASLVLVRRRGSR